MAVWTVPARFDTAQNAEIVAFLRRENPSAHSDLDEELARATSGLGLQAFCPDASAYAFVAWHRADDTIVALAYGTKALAFRLPEASLDDALRDGAEIDPALGARWVRFDPWRLDKTLPETQQLLASWCAVAARADAAGLV